MSKFFNGLKAIAVFLIGMAALTVIGLGGLALMWLAVPALVCVAAFFVVWAAFQD